MSSMSSFDRVREVPDSATPYPDRASRGRERSEPHPIVSNSPALREALNRLDRVAPTDATVMITGETGTGKELVARAIHRRSRRAAQPLVALNLAAVPESLVSSELFGHEHGAFTGAVQRRIGRFEQADRATIFFDEIGELSNDMQVSLLRLLQEGAFERLGSSQTRHVDVRVIAATHRVLEAEVKQQRFRADLFYRLSVFPIHLPPLRERADDIPALVHHFLRDLERKLGRRFAGIEPASLARLQGFSWPGNIRQLENVIEQSAILCDESILHVPPPLLDELGSAWGTPSRLDVILDKNEQQMIEEALANAGGRVAGRSGAAARLGVPPSTLESKIKRFSIDKCRYRMERP